MAPDEKVRGRGHPNKITFLLEMDVNANVEESSLKVHMSTSQCRCREKGRGSPRGCPPETTNVRAIVVETFL